MRKYLRWIAAGIVAFMAGTITVLSKLLKKTKREKAVFAAKAETYEKQMDEILTVQKKLDTVDKEEAPEKSMPPTDPDERLARLNRVSDKTSSGE